MFAVARAWCALLFSWMTGSRRTPGEPCVEPHGYMDHANPQLEKMRGLEDLGRTIGLVPVDHPRERSQLYRRPSGEPGRAGSGRPGLRAWLVLIIPGRERSERETRALSGTKQWWLMCRGSQ